MNEIVLEGCTPTPLASYLKALGVLRLLADQADPDAKGFWKSGRFILKTVLDQNHLKQYFLNEYRPSPILSPWSGRAGFLEGGDEEKSKRKGAVTLDTVEHASGKRFEAYRSVIRATRNVSVITRLDKTRAEVKALDKQKKRGQLDEAGLEQLSKVKRVEAELKGALLQSLRAELADDFLPWLDACFALAAEKRTTAPLLGSGGNEGSMDFSINHVGYLLKLIDPQTDEPTPLAQSLLPNSLFAATQFLDTSSNIGFLDTLATGGVNMTTGFEGGSTGNLWDSVLALEGAVLFASATTKRLESTASGRPSFPFAVSPTYAGEGSIASNESARPELWLPTWQAPASLAEVFALFAEGRATLGKHQAGSGMQMLQALSALGISRGISAFERFGFYERRGQGYYVATYLGRHDVPDFVADNWLIRDLEQNHWLERFRRFAQGNLAANRFRALHRRFEDQLFSLVGRQPSKAEAQALLILLGEIQTALSIKAQATKKPNEELPPPIPRLSEQWVTAANDDDTTFRIAKALAGLKGTKEQPLPLRAQLFPVERVKDRWMTPESGEKQRICTGQRGRLVDTLRVLLARRLWLAEKLDMRDKPLDSPAGATLLDMRDKPLDSPAGTTLADIEAFLRDERMDGRIAELLLGLALCTIPQDHERNAGEGVVPAAFALMKLCLTPHRALQSLDLLAKGEKLPVPPGMLAQLAAGNHGNRALKTAWRRLRASDLAPAFAFDSLPTESSINPQRAAAALLIPLRFGTTAALARSVLKQPEPA